MKQHVIKMSVLLFCLSVFPQDGQAITTEELGKMKAALPTSASVKPAQPRKLLVFTKTIGFRHSSIPYGIKALELMGEKTGAFTIMHSEKMNVFAPESLSTFDAVCFCNTTDLDFPDPVHRKALMEFVRGGKGIVGIHSATANFYNWPEAAEMMGGVFDGHPWNAGGTWAVKLSDPDHRLTASFGGKGFQISDEIYRIKPRKLRENCHVLCGLDMTSPLNLNTEGLTPGDVDLPISWVRDYGRGRVFYSSLGHNEHIYWNPAVLQHYLDGILFALGDLKVDTTPSLIDKALYGQLLDPLRKYEYGMSRKPLTALTDHTRSFYTQPNCLLEVETVFLNYMQSNASLTSKQGICRLLREMGSEQAAKVLGPMLTDPETDDMARYVLENIPGLNVNQVFRTALSDTTGIGRIGIINALGHRRDTYAVEILEEFLFAVHDQTARAAAGALGTIGGQTAVAKLSKARKKPADRGEM